MTGCAGSKIPDDGNFHLRSRHCAAGEGIPSCVVWTVCGHRVVNCVLDALARFDRIRKAGRCLFGLCATKFFSAPSSPSSKGASIDQLRQHVHTVGPSPGGALALGWSGPPIPATSAFPRCPEILCVIHLPCPCCWSTRSTPCPFPAELGLCVAGLAFLNRVAGLRVERREQACKA